MTRRWMAALAAGWMLVACGGNSLPPGDTQDPPDDVLPGDPVDPGDPPDNGDNGDDEQPAASTSLWPLTTGSTWVYAITNDGPNGNYQKTVTVVGPREVPELRPAMNAVLVHSRQDRTAIGIVYEEYSYQLELTDGTVVRLREEDFKDGEKVRTTTWKPATVKSLARIPESLPWKSTNGVQELTVMGDGSEEESDPTYEWRVLETGLTMTTSAGTFTNVVKVQRDKLNDRGEVKLDKVRYYWLAPGVGKIREESEERTEELISFDIKK